MRLLLVVAFAVAIALTAILSLSWRHEMERLEQGQRVAARRNADVARVLLRRDVERGIILTQGLGNSGAILTGVAARDRDHLGATLQRFHEESRLHAVVLDASGRVLAASSPLALRLALRPNGQGSHLESRTVTSEVIAGDLSALINWPLSAAGRKLGTLRVAVPVGRNFVEEATDDLGVPIGVYLRQHVLHHTFPSEPPDPDRNNRRRLDLGGIGYDIAFLPSKIFDSGDIWVVAGQSRLPLAQARRRYLALVGALGGGGLVLVMLTVGGFMLVSRRRERRLVSQRDEALDRSRGLTDRLAHLTAVVHDIKAPIGGIQLRCEGLAEGTDDGVLRAALAQIVDTCERLNLYLVNILTAAEAEEGPIRTKAEVVLVGGLLEEVCERVGALAEHRGVRLVAAADASLPPISGDAALLERALWNLASNAIAATPSGGTVELFAEKVGDRLRLGVRDTGSGFEGFDPTEAFERTRYRVKDSSIRAGSTGLGLFIVARIAEAHGGSAEARNREVGGAEVSLSLPAHGG